MAEARQYHAVAILDGKLYAVGGYGLSSAERYDPVTNAWEAVAPMAEARQSGMAVLDGKLYAVGGFNNNDHLSSVERYDPGTDAWEAVAPLTLARFGAGVAALEGKLYAMGGRVEEDDEVNRAVARLGKKAWAQVAEELNASGVTGPGCARTGKQVRARWVSSLDPDIRSGPWTAAEERECFEP